MERTFEPAAVGVQPGTDSTCPVFSLNAVARLKATFWCPWTPIAMASRKLPKNPNRPAGFGWHQALANQDGVMYLDIHDRTVRKPFAVDGCSNYVLSNDCLLVAVGPRDDEPRRIDIFNVETNAKVGTLDGFSEDAAPVAFVDSGRRVAVRGKHNFNSGTSSLTIFNLETGKHTPSFDAIDWRGTFSPDGSRYAAVAPENAVRIWDTETGQVLCTTGSHSSHIWAIAFSPDGQILASAGEGRGRDKLAGEIKIWDVASGREVTSIIDDTSWGVTALKISPEGRELAGGNAKGDVRFWKIPETHSDRRRESRE